jgi:hypothetical protein
MGFRAEKCLIFVFVKTWLIWIFGAEISETKHDFIIPKRLKTTAV